MSKTIYYSLKNILDKHCHYNLIIGERSNGKTYAVKQYILEQYTKGNGQGALVRRWHDDIKATKSQSMWADIVKNDLVEKYTNGEYNDIYYNSGKFYLCRWDENLNTRVCDNNPFCYIFAVNTAEHYKSLSYPDITTVLFDEFLTKGYYLPDEFVLFMNLLSTIIRLRDNVKIFMCGNTVNPYSPYFKEFGITDIKTLQQGEIRIYTYGNSGLRLGLEFSDLPSKKKASDVYFAFDNPKLQMITGKGQVWEMDIYPHCPCKYLPKDIIFTYFIVWDGGTYQCEVVKLDTKQFTYIHKKTTPLKDTDHDLIFSTEYDARYNWRRKITKPFDAIGSKIYSFFKADMVYYQDNTVGNDINNYLKWCG